MGSRNNRSPVCCDHHGSPQPTATSAAGDVDWMLHQARSQRPAAMSLAALHTDLVLILLCCCTDAKLDG
eukprot:4772850-Amphidinium_carterae.1